MWYEIWGYNKALLQRGGLDVWLEGVQLFKTKDVCKALAVYTDSQKQTAFDSLILFRDGKPFAEHLKD